MLGCPSLLVRACAATLAVVWLALPLVGALDAGEHAHRYCAEHRAFEELAGKDLMAPLAAPRAEVALMEGEGEGASHARCALAWSQARQAVLQPSCLLPPVAASRRLLLLEASVGYGSGVPLLALAPKGSPPGR